MKRDTLIHVFAILLLLVGSLAAVQTSASAATLVVNTSADDESNGCGIGNCTLREAINDAASSDVITFKLASYPATITLSGAVTIDNNLTIQGPGASFLSVSGGANNQIFNISNAKIVQITDLTITNGSTSGGNGANINNYGTLTLKNSIVSWGTALFGGLGGGIYNAGTLTVNNSTFSDNTANGSGGAIYNDTSGMLTIKNSLFTDNTASANGGAVYNA